MGAADATLAQRLDLARGVVVEAQVWERQRSQLLHHVDVDAEERTIGLARRQACKQPGEQVLVAPAQAHEPTLMIDAEILCCDRGRSFTQDAQCRVERHRGQLAEAQALEAGHGPQRGDEDAHRVGHVDEPRRRVDARHLLGHALHHRHGAQRRRQAAWSDGLVARIAKRDRKRLVVMTALPAADADHVHHDRRAAHGGVEVGGGLVSVGEPAVVCETLAIASDDLRALGIASVQTDLQRRQARGACGEHVRQARHEGARAAEDREPRVRPGRSR
ncbi:MAG: hypothetical protein U1E76_13120 [Planctomycetota bacterium]